MTTRPSPVLTVDLAALAANYRTLCARAGTAVAGVVKANAYGIGLMGAMRVLEDEKCPFYFVATLQEGIAARTLTRMPVAVLAGPDASEHDDYRAHGLTPVINHVDQIAFVAAWNMPAIVHVDTGMNRLGIAAAEFEALLSLNTTLRTMPILYLMSHFACADEGDHPLTAAQAATFARVREIFDAYMGRKIPASLANSSGVFRSADYALDLVRPGMALYGLNPTPEKANPMKAVVALSARVLQVRRAAAGETVGYGATHTLARPSLLATAAIGYADGFLRSLSGRGALYHNGVRCPILGRVSMDLTVIDLTDLHARVLPPVAGDLVEVIGPNQSADQLASDAGTIGYEILTQLSRRAARHVATG